MTDLASNTLSPPNAPHRHEDRFQLIAISALSFLATVILLISLNNLGVLGSGWMAFVKAAIYGSGAWLVSYGISRLAIGRGIPMILRGAYAPAIMGGLSIFLVGCISLSATFPGLVIDKVQESELFEHNAQVGPYVDGRLQVAKQSADLVPIVHAMAEDLAAQQATEGRSGNGPIAQMLENLTGRTRSISEQMTVSLGVRDEVLERIKALRQDMDLALSDEGASIWDRRTTYRRLYTDLLSQLSELDRALPTSVVRSYVAELDSGVQIPNREDATARINRRLAGYSATLVDALEEQQGVSGPPPALPEPTGAIDCFAYIGKHAPIFGLTLLIDVIFPLLVWFYAFWTYKVLLPPKPKDQRPPTDADAVAGTQSVDVHQVQREAKQRPLNGDHSVADQL